MPWHGRLETSTFNLPLDYNDGPPIPESKYVSLQQDLLTRFGGITSACSADMLLGVREINNGRSPYVCGARCRPLSLSGRTV